jgi:type IV pilus assembly protein PilN
MAKINLLPWRAERRVAKQKEFYAMLGFAAVCGVALSVLLWFYYDVLVIGQNQRIGFLKSEITKVDAQIKEIDDLDKQKSRLLARKKVIEELQANRSQMVHLFDSVARTIPDGVVLTSIKQDGDRMTLEGSAQSNARVSAYMRALETSGWMTKPELTVIEARAAQTAGPINHALPYHFSLQVHLSSPNAVADDSGKPGAPAPAAASPAAVPAAPATAPAAAPPAVAMPAVPPTAPAVPAPATQSRPAS